MTGAYAETVFRASLPEILFSVDLALALRVGEAAARALLRSGRFPAVKVGRRWAVRRDLLLRALTPGTVPFRVMTGATMNDVEREGLRPAEIAARLGVSPGAVRSWISTGKLRALKIGTCLIVRRASLDEFLAAHEFRPVQQVFLRHRHKREQRQAQHRAKE